MSAERPRQFVVIGFPKCGTTAIMRRLKSVPGIHVGSALEARLSLLPEEAIPTFYRHPTKIYGHKFSGYIYHPKDLAVLEHRSVKTLYLLGHRHPLKSLVSWHNMHRKIARGPELDHFAWKERDFFGKCSIDEYYRKTAHKLLCYDTHLESLLGWVPHSRIVAFSQARMSQDMNGTLSMIAQSLGIEYRGSVPHERHVGFADKETPAVAPGIAAELDGSYERFLQLIATSGVTAIA